MRYNENKEPKVDFFLVGMPRCGTTSLYKILKRHPKVFLPKIKEPNFFAQDKIKANKVKKIAWQTTIEMYEQYLKLYSKADPEKIKGDFSVYYSVSRIAPFKIVEYNPDAKIIMIFRNPITLLESKIKYTNYYGVEANSNIETAYFSQYSNPDFARGTMFLNPVRNHYDSWLQYDVFAKRYIDIFGRDKILFLLYEEIKSDFIKTYEKICSFLGITPEENIEEIWENRSKVAKNNRLSKIMASNVVKKLRGIIPKKLRSPIGAKIMNLQSEQKDKPSNSSTAFKKMLLYELKPMIERLDSFTGLDATNRWKFED